MTKDKSSRTPRDLRIYITLTVSRCLEMPEMSPTLFQTESVVLNISRSLDSHARAWSS